MNYIVNKKFGLITSEKGCRVVDYEKLGSELRKDDNIAEVGHLYNKGDEFILDDFCKNILELLLDEGYIKAKGIE